MVNGIETEVLIEAPQQRVRHRVITVYFMNKAVSIQHPVLHKIREKLVKEAQYLLFVLSNNRA